MQYNMVIIIDVSDSIFQTNSQKRSCTQVKISCLMLVSLMYSCSVVPIDVHAIRL